MNVRVERRRGSGLRSWLLAATCILSPAAPIGVLATQGASEARTAPVRAITDWNSRALVTTAAGRFSPPRETRTLAMMSAAVFDAVNSITLQFQPYRVRVKVPRGASVEAAIHAAAFRVLAAEHPEAAAVLIALRDSALARLPADRSRADGTAAGDAVAAAILGLRERDGADRLVTYAPAAEVGKWTPTPPSYAAALEAGWGAVTPFLMDSGSQCRPGPPPVVGSSAYLKDLAEIERVGASNSSTRTAAQAESARLWVATAPQLWNQVARQAIVAHGLDASSAARALLLLNMAGADAIIAAWDAKFAYQQWRPVTGIRHRGTSGSLTSGDSAWTPLLTTPPFPDYPAGHTAFAGAAERVLGALLGDGPGDYAIASPTAGSVVHRYRTFREIADEVVGARVWGGVHWRTSSVAGRDLGQRVGDVALARGPR